jgi:hypothetical protein
MSEKTHDSGSILSDLKALVRRLLRVKKQAEAIGLFTNDRE